MVHLDSSNDIDLGSAGAKDSGPVWSPDGNSIAVRRWIGSACHAVVLPATGGAGTDVYGSLLNEARALFWSSDGTRLVGINTAYGPVLITVATAAHTTPPGMTATDEPLGWQP
ncbi:MAG: hypothetical protein ABSB75_03925 [Candidatus Limnocylindrales bacterium]